MDLYCCDVAGCMKSYKSKVNLKRHKDALHSDTKSFQCGICSKILSSKQNLKEHSLLHSNELPFICSYEGCNKRFRHGSQYSAHKKVHISVCDLSSTSLKSLDLKLITRQLSTIKDYVPITVNKNEMSPGLKLPSIGISQIAKLPNLGFTLSDNS